MKLKEHIIISFSVSVLVLLLSNSIKLSLISFITGVFTDLDHIIDYFIEFGNKFNIKHFFYIFHNKRIIKVMLIFHAWEWLILFLLYALYFGFNEWIAGFFIGLSQHIILDQIFNKPHKFGYFLLWRYNNNFLLNKIFPSIIKEKNK